MGDLHIHALKDGRFITRLVDTRKEPSVQIDFTNASACQTTELDGAEYDVVPPKDNMKFAVRLTDEQKATQQQRFDHAASLLHRKEGTFHTEQSAAQAAQALGLDGACAEYAAKALFDAKGNADEVHTFLQNAADSKQMQLRAKLLHQLTVKDKTDLKADILEQHIRLAPAQGDLPEEIYIPYLLSPRVEHETLTAFRRGLLDAFSAEQKEQFAADPHQLWAWILQHISSNDDREYGSLTTTPNALLKVGYGSHNSKKVLFTAICRTIGVPARINPETHAVQFYRDGGFHNVEQSEQGSVLPFTLLSGDDTKWVDRKSVV